MKRAVAKSILWLLLPEQKEHCAEVANDLLQTSINEPDFLKKLITRDELWVYSYDPETKADTRELCEVPRWPLWRGLRRHCPMYNVSCILFNIQPYNHALGMHTSNPGIMLWPFAPPPACWVPWLPTQSTRSLREDFGGGDSGGGSPTSTPEETIHFKPSPFHPRSCRAKPMSYPIGKAFIARLCLLSLSQWT